MQKFRTALKVLSVGLLFATAGCSVLSSMNPFASKPSTRNAPAPLVEFKPTLNAKTVWSTSVGKADNYAFTPALVRNDVFTAAAAARSHASMRRVVNGSGVSMPACL